MGFPPNKTQYYIMSITLQIELSNIIFTLWICLPFTLESLEYNLSSQVDEEFGSSASTNAFKGEYWLLGNWYARVRCRDFTCGSKLIAEIEIISTEYYNH